MRSLIVTLLLFSMKLLADTKQIASNTIHQSSCLDHIF